MTTVWDLNLFYPFLFLTIIVLIATIGLVITKTKDNGLFNNIFNKHTDEHIDTTDKLSKAHTEVVEAKFTPAHETQMQEISAMLTDITNRVIELEKKK